MYNTTTGQNPPKADYCSGSTGRGNSKPKIVITVVTSTTQSISAGPARL